MRTVPPAVLGDLRVLYAGGTLTGDTDGQLLERFTARNLAERAEADVAFTMLLQRHGRMVWSVCRSLLPDEHDAEDAFQATFVVLVRKASLLRVQYTVGPWLHAVATRVSMSARAAGFRRQKLERAAARQAMSRQDVRCREQSREFDGNTAALHREITRLPEKLRAAVVLCDIEGLSYQQAAASLCVPLGTLQSRLARARRRLRKRFQKEGVAPTDPADGLPLIGRLIEAEMGTRAPSLALEQITLRGCLDLAAGPARLNALFSATAQRLIDFASRPTFWSRWSGVAAVLCAAILVNDSTEAKPLQQDGSGTQKAATPSPQAATANSVVAEPLRAPAPQEPRATAGRGRALVYALDPKGDRIRMPEVVAKTRRRRIGGVERGPAEEIFVDLSWVVVTAVVDHRAVQETFADGDDGKSLPGVGIYRRVDLQYQTQVGGSWSTWRAIDFERKYRILDNLPEHGPERTNEAFRVDNLVDPVPVFVEGAPDGLDVERLVPQLRDGKLVDPLQEFGQFKKSDRPPVLMLRAYDFATVPGKTFRYRARLVFFTPRKTQRGTAWPEFRGPWSEPTNPVLAP